MPAEELRPEVGVDAERKGRATSSSPDRCTRLVAARGVVGLDPPAQDDVVGQAQLEVAEVLEQDGGEIADRAVVAGGEVDAILRRARRSDGTARRGSWPASSCPTRSRRPGRRPRRAGAVSDDLVQRSSPGELG